MMRVCSVVCDRCGGCIVDQGSMIEVGAGALRQRFSEALDLCSDSGSMSA
jgi:hypothetical protein